nr:polysaccharide biosynthesis C-terminal domain-containing protein [Solobacterium sp.]
MKTGSNNIDIVNGPLAAGILRFAWPLMLSNLLQIAFHSADTLVIGRFAGPAALAAVGTAGPVSIFFTWGLNGLSIGANVIISRLIGKQDHDSVKQAVCTAFLIGVCSGFIVLCLGTAGAGLFMRLMSVPEDILAYSVLYMRIFFLAAVPVGIYDFCAAVLRSDGDTARATLYLAIGGVINVLLNLLFVIVLHLGVAGVATATVISHWIAAVLILKRLLSYEGIIQLKPKETFFDRSLAAAMLKSGIPSALQNQLFSFSNIMIQSSFNTFGSAVIAANTAALCVEEYVYV